MGKKRKKVKPKQNNESDVYVRLDPNDALEAKKESLEITASLIKLQIINNKIKNHGKREITDRNSAKRVVKGMSTIIGKIISEMPKIKTPKIHKEHHEKPQEMQVIQETPKKIKTKAGKNKIKQKLTLNEELMAIKQKLEGLN